MTVQIHKHLRLGQAIVNALKASGDLDWFTDPKTGKLIYSVTGKDLFYITDDELLAILEKDAKQ
jgi:hypothetical protein